MSKVASNVSFTNEQVCYTFPARLRSGGVFSPDFFTGTVQLLNIQILMIVILSNLLHFFLHRLGIISFTSQCLAGVILGPTILAKYDYYRDHIFPQKSQDALVVTANMGYSMFMFLTGVKMDFGMLLRSGRKVMILGIATVLLPYMIGLGFQFTRIEAAPGLLERMQIIGSTAIQSMTTFPVVSHLMTELKLTNTELGRLALSTSLISGIVAASLELGATIITQIRGILNAGLTLGSALFAAFVLRPIMVWVIGQTPEGQKVHPACVPLLFAVAVVYEIFFDAMNQSPAMGPFVLGLAVPPGPPLGSAVVQSMETVTTSVFFPLFVVTAVMRGDLASFFWEFDNKGYYGSSLVMATVTKFLVCLFLSLPWMPRRDSVVLSLIMCSKGVYELSVYTFHRDTTSINEGYFSLNVVAIFINTVIIPILIKHLYDPSRKYAGYQSRNLFSLKPRTELRVLPCIYKPDHIISTINLLDLTCPTQDNPLGVYALHLVELVGRATPVFVSHQKQKPVSDSCSIDVILAFNQYERRSQQQHIGTPHAAATTTTVGTFTSISHHRFMSDDICTLALDKEVSLLLLPFHVKWGADGRVECADNSFRIVNSKVLERAPCSVGIFFDRGSFVSRQTTSDGGDDQPDHFYSVCVIYMGGGDDHEALCFAMRAAREPSLRLTILHLVPSDDDDDDMSVSRRRNARMASERLYDEVVLKEAMKGISGLANVRYEEHAVEDGPQTALLVREIANEHDLFVVGRRHGLDSKQTMGLTEWSEFPELGVVGDLLASPDLETKTSVLVVQQQKQVKK
ncbi:unnamed protein product [Linum tenue]|uniref:Cation/H+ exchanger domain-containing protein n=1 Tax=Linum tenue TaxID=586396 RepID=A0AAV0QEB3_9ROSI|nr:unnamed protein product [Linum tenue]